MKSLGNGAVESYLSYGRKEIDVRDIYGIPEAFAFASRNFIWRNNSKKFKNFFLGNSLTRAFNFNIIYLNRGNQMFERRTSSRVAPCEAEISVPGITIIVGKTTV